MSYDIEIYCALDPSLPENLSGRGWQILITGPSSLEPEDIPDGVRAHLPGLKYLVQMHLEGNWPESTLTKALSLAKKMAKSYFGVVVDLQAVETLLPRGIKRFRPASDRPEDPGSLEISWFFDAARFSAPDTMERVLSLMGSSIPETLPRRYGLWEPPQFRLDREGLDHFKRFLASNLDEGVVWYGSKPFEQVFLNVPPAGVQDPRGFRSGRLSVLASGDLLHAPGWALELERFWLSMSDILCPFYAEIRAGRCPVEAWWWNGIPVDSPLALLIGPPYLELWPDLGGEESRSSARSYLSRLTSPDLQLPTPPPNLGQPSNRLVELDPNTGAVLSEVMLDRQYPETWPFS